MKYYIKSIEESDILDDVNQSDVAKEVGCSRNYISLVARGRRIVNEEMFHKISEIVKTMKESRNEYWEFGEFED